MTIRLLLTLLVFGLGGAECQSNSAPAWVQQNDSVTAQALETESSVAELNEHFDSDHDVLPAHRPVLRPILPSTENTRAVRSVKVVKIVPCARAPPYLA